MLNVGHCNIDFFIFCHRFQIFGPKFMKFKREETATENFQIFIITKAKIDQI
jgi:hypothetical protein